MNPLDWLLGLLLVYSTVRAAMRGFFREAFSLAGLIVGFLLACWFYHSAALQLGGLVTSVPLAQFAAFVLILLATMIVATLLATVLKRTASAIGLGIVDRLLGAAFGLVRGLVLGVALLTALTAFLPPAPWIAESRLAPYFLRASRAVFFVMPAELEVRLRDGADQLKHTTPGWIKQPSSSHTN
jgi:membrane protein required for colicin V production